jgi:hypothetical protein
MGQSHKLFGINLLTLFCKLDRFINAYNNYHSVVKRSILQTRVSKFSPKKFYEINSRPETKANQKSITRVKRSSLFMGAVKTTYTFSAF